MKGKVVILLALSGMFAVALFAAGCGQNAATDSAGAKPGSKADAGSASSGDHQGMSTAEHQKMMSGNHQGMSAAEHQKMMSGDHQGMSAAEHRKMMSGEGESGGGHGGGHGGHEKQTPIEDIEDVPPLTTERPVRIAFPGVKIEPRVVRLKAGEITFLVTNDDTEGGRSHNFRIARWKDGARPARGEIVEPGPWMGPGGKREFTVWLKPGTYYVYCAQADHEESGMTAKIIVEP